jgi:acyl-CoA dehydrogenase
MSETRQMLDDSVTRLFTGTITPEGQAEAEQGAWLAQLWDAVESNGLLAAHLDEDKGGAGATWHEVFVVARACGRHAVPLPIVETMLGRWLLARAGLGVPSGALGLAAAPLADVGTGRPLRLPRVPWGRHVQHVVVSMPAAPGVRIGVASTAGAHLTTGHNLAREPRDTLTIASPHVQAADAPLPGDIVTLYGAMLRAAQMAGALETILDLSVTYANERVQFGRPIGRFQVIQQELARLAGLVAAAGTAAESAARAASEATATFTGAIGVAADPAFEIAAAKVVAGEAAEHGPRIAHQVHGAIGFTYEHRLQFFTRRLWAWRAEFGTAETWAERLGAAVLGAGAERLWPLVTGR